MLIHKFTSERGTRAAVASKPDPDAVEAAAVAAAISAKDQKFIDDHFVIIPIGFGRKS